MNREQMIEDAAFQARDWDTVRRIQDEQVHTPTEAHEKPLDTSPEPVKNGADSSHVNSTDDEREALVRYEAWHEGYAARMDGKSVTEGPSHPNAPSRARRPDTALRQSAPANVTHPEKAYIPGGTMSVSGQGEPTDAQVQAAAREYHERGNGEGSFDRIAEHIRASLVFRMRAALRAAAATQTGEQA